MNVILEEQSEVRSLEVVQGIINYNKAGSTLIHEMQKRKVKKGLATLCIGGGMGIAMCIENNF